MIRRGRGGREGGGGEQDEMPVGGPGVWGHGRLAVDAVPPSRWRWRLPPLGLLRCQRCHLRLVGVAVWHRQKPPGPPPEVVERLLRAAACAVLPLPAGDGDGSHGKGRRTNVGPWHKGIVSWMCDVMDHFRYNRNVVSEALRFVDQYVGHLLMEDSRSLRPSGGAQAPLGGAVQALASRSSGATSS